jgi:hypothetical protein
MAEPYYDWEGDKKNIESWKNLWSGIKDSPSALWDLLSTWQSTANNKPQIPSTETPNGFKELIGLGNRDSEGVQVWPSPLSGYPDWMPDYEVQPPVGFLQMPETSTEDGSESVGGGSGGGSHGYNPTPYTESDSLKELRGLIDQYSKRKGSMDLSPLAALTDTWTGSQFARSYEAPETQSDIDAKAIALKDRLADKELQDKQKHQYTNYLMAQMQAKKEKSEQAQALKELMSAQKAQEKGQTQASREQKSLEIKAARNMKQFDMALETFMPQVFPEINEAPDPTIRDVYKAKINGMLTQLGKDNEENKLAPVGSGYAKAMQDILSNPEMLNRFRAKVQ